MVHYHMENSAINTEGGSFFLYKKLCRQNDYVENRLMWENERKKTIISNIVVGLLLVVIVALLGVAMLRVMRQINEEDEQLSVIKQEQQQQLNDNRQGNIDAIQHAYDQDMETIASYMPGIVCWGDSLTAGSSGNVSYPGMLQKYIDIYLCGVYDLRYTIDNAAEYSWLDWSEYKVSIPVVNMGSGQENSSTVLGRAGVKPYVIQKSFEIPGEMETVEISFTSSDGKQVNPLTAGDMEMNPVTIAGVEGTLSLESSGWKSKYYFCRSEAGNPVTVEEGAEIQVASASKYQDYIHIVWLGTYDGNVKPEMLVQEVKQLLTRQIQNPDRYLVIGPCSYNGNWSGGASNLNAIDTAMMQAFGKNYVNLRKYLIEDGLMDAELTPSRADTASMTMGYVPDSFRSGAGSVNLNGQAYTLAGKVIYERLEALGYFDEIRDELGIDITTQEILKNDPEYFISKFENG